MKEKSHHKLTPYQHAALLIILLSAAFLRFFILPNFPPGIEHDEVAEVLIADGILQGQHALFFSEAYGQEPLFLYLVAGAFVLLGRNILALRFVTAAVGMLSVAAATRLARRLFNHTIALTTAAGMAVMFWPVFWSRVGLRGMLLPLFMCLAADAMWRALYQAKSSQHYAVLSGLWWGLAMYTYLASRGIPILLGAFLAYGIIFERACARARWRELIIVLGVFALVAAPITLYLHYHPEVQTRVYEVQAPLTALKQGEIKPVLHNALQILGMFNIQGDATERNNLPNRPVFTERIWGIFFITGGLIALLRLRKPPYGLILLWLGVMLSPTLVTTDAPNFVRALGALPVIMLLPGIGVDWLYSKLQQRTTRTLFTLIIILAFGLNMALTAFDYFGKWAQIPEVGFVWQHDLLAVADWLDQHPDVHDVAVGGLSNTSMDAPSLEMMLRRKDVQVRWADPGSPLGAGGAFVIPAATANTDIYFLLPAVVPLSQAIEAQLQANSITITQRTRFTEFLFAPRDPSTGKNPTPFTGNISWLSFSLSTSNTYQPGENFTTFSTWVIEEGAHPPLKAFLHLVDAEGTPRAQHDGLDSAAPYWQPGDLIVQSHTLQLPSDLTTGTYTLRLGLYDRETLMPYPLMDGRAYIEVGTLDIQTP